MKLTNLCFVKLLKISACLTRQDWHNVIAHIVDWKEFARSELYTINLLSATATSPHVFSAFRTQLDWRAIIDNIQRSLFTIAHSAVTSAQEILAIERVIEIGCSFVDWTIVSSMASVTCLSDNFFDKYKDLLYWPAICRGSCSEEFLLKHLPMLDWSTVSLHQTLSDAFLICHREKIYWRKYLEIHRIVTPAVLITAAEHVPIDYLAEKQILPADVIAFLAANIDICYASEQEWFEKQSCLYRFWTYVSRNSAVNMDNSFLFQFEHHIDWYALTSTTQVIDEHHILEHSARLNWVNLCFNGSSITRRIVDLRTNCINWPILSRYGANIVLFTEEFMQAYQHCIDFASLPARVLISTSIIERWEDRLNWSEISQSNILYPNAFIKKYAARLDWQAFSKRREIDEEIVYENMQRVAFDKLSQNQRFLANAKDKFFFIAGRLLDWALVFKAVGREFRWKPSRFMTFVRKWIEFADWPTISQFKGGLTINFISQFAPHLTWSHVLLNCRSIGINLAFVQQFRTYIHWPSFLTTLSRIQDSAEVIKIATEFADRLDLGRFLMLYRNQFGRDPPETFLTEFFDLIGATNISKCRNLSGEFMVRFANRLCWPMVSYHHQHLDSAFMLTWGERLVDYISWHDIPNDVVANWSQDVYDKFLIFLKRG